MVYLLVGMHLILTSLAILSWSVALGPRAWRKRKTKLSISALCFIPLLNLILVVFLILQIRQQHEDIVTFICKRSAMYISSEESTVYKNILNEIR